jgi:uroporphyrinogen-III synthase
MRILITRPRMDAEPLAERLHALGHTTIVEALFDIVFRDGPPLDLAGVQALVFTSANGARAAARRTPERNMPVLAVGPATASTARALGFHDVSESEGEGVDGLAAHIRATLSPNKGTLLHPTGRAVAGDLAAALAPHGYRLHREVVYDTHPAEALSGALATELGAGLVTAAMFFSPRTAQLFAALTGAASLGTACHTVSALALSEAVAKALAPVTFRRIFVAETPTTDAMLQLLPGI